MIDIIPHSDTHSLVYVTVDEKKTFARLMRIRNPDASYFGLKHRPLADHWILHNITVGKVFKTQQSKH